MGEGHDVVFTHGIGEDHRSWRQVQRALRKECRSHAHDIRGHGDTPLGDADGTLSQLGGDVEEILAGIGSEPKVVVGYSLGGTIALWVAAHHPGLVKAVVAVATSSVVGSRAAAGYRETIDLLRSGDRPAIVDSFREHLQAGLFRKDVAVEPILASNLEAMGDGRGYINASEAMVRVHDEPLTPLLPAIKCPVLVIAADHDAFCPRKAQQIILEGLAHGRYEEIPNAGHLVLEEAPDVVAATIAKFLSALPA
jgi:pimeloyl-ACP methyl ester carboxylesterase